MTLYRLNGHEPTLAASAWVAPNAQVIGQATLGERSSVWFGAILRADNDRILIGNDSNIQDGAVLHTDPGLELIIGERVTVGHQAILHGCSIGDGSLIGIQAVILNRAVIGRECLVGAGALITEGKVFPDGALIIGAPAKVARMLSTEERQALSKSATAYVSHAALYRGQLQRID